MTRKKQSIPFYKNVNFYWIYILFSLKYEHRKTKNVKKKFMFFKITLSYFCQ